MGEFNKFLVKARESLGLTQSEVADALGYSNPQFVSNAERGLCALPVKKFKRLSKILRVPVETLIDHRMTDIERELYKEAGL